MEYVIAVAVLILLAIKAYELLMRSQDTLIKKTVVVNLKTGDAIKGVLLHEHSNRFTLAQAVYMTGQAETPMDGFQHIPKSNVAFLQEPQTKE